MTNVNKKMFFLMKASLTPLLTACVGGAEVVVSFPLITVVPSDVEFDKSLVSRFRILR